LTSGVVVKSWFRFHKRPLWCGVDATAADVDVPAAAMSPEATVVIAVYRIVPLLNASTLIRRDESMNGAPGRLSGCRTGSRRARPPGRSTSRARCANRDQRGQIDNALAAPFVDRRVGCLATPSARARSRAS